MSFRRRARVSSIFRVAFVAFAALVGSACASAPEPRHEGRPGALAEDGTAVVPANPASSARPALWPAPFRLSPDVRPESYRLHLRIDPTQQESSGTAEIDVVLAAPVTVLRLHAEGLVITEAVATPRRGAPPGPPGLPDAPPVPLEAVLDGGGNLALVAPAPLGGPFTLRLAYRAPLTETPDSLYRAKEGADWYAFTQFEPIAARRAFPCFDEPRFKTPWSLTIDAPAGSLAVANTPEVAREQLAGWTRFRFAESAPLPSYLVAFAVGPFDMMEGPAVSGGRVPFRILTTRGKAGLAAYTLARTPAILAWLEGWFGTPYPFAKLDLLAVPSFAAGAMENPGLITFRELAILVSGEPARAEQRRWNDGILAHELGHMWFGDLVTLAWWDDLWLNEAFATWIGNRALAALRPEYAMELRAVVDANRVMDEDARTDARAVRQPIREEGDIGNAFDGITYSKGKAVLAMLEDWIGPETFQAGVRAYLAARAGGTATRDDLVEHLTKAAGGLEVAAVLGSFIEQPGVPVVGVDWTCGKPGVGGAVDVTLRVSQRAFRALGDGRDADQRWVIPVCLVAGDIRAAKRHAGGEVTVCEVLREPVVSKVVAMPFCPSWIRANGQARGYYRVATERALPAPARAAPEHTLGWLAALRARVGAAEVSAAEAGELFAAYLAQATAMLARPQGEIAFDEAMSAIGAVRRLVEDDPAALALLRAKLRKIVGVQMKLREDPWALGTLAKLALVHVHDARAEKEALRVTERWLLPYKAGDHAELPSLDGQSVGQATLWMPLRARALGYAPKDAEAREALWQLLRAAVTRAPTPADRATAITALASFDVPELVTRAWDLLLDGTLRAQDLRTLSGPRHDARPEVARAVWAWVALHYDALEALVGPKGSPQFPAYANALCSDEDARTVEAFFEARRATWVSGLAHHLKLTLETIRRCAALKGKYGAAARAWLATP